MGRDVTLYPRKATKKELKDYLENLGFEKCEHLWDWPKGTLNYSWFDNEDFKSIDGVSADIYLVADDELEITGNKWALHVRNLYSASWHDVKMLNDVLKNARRLFGGTIRGDYGTNRYAPLWDDVSTPISRGVSATYQYISRELSFVILSLPDSFMKQPQETDGSIDEYIEFIMSFDPSRAIYNGLVPFAVSMFESFFSRVFQILIAYDGFALEKRNTYKIKVDFSTLLEIDGKERSIENVIASSYSFQNLNQLNKAYKDWLNIDVRKILYKKKKVGKSIKFLENRISDIIQYRHGIVHRFEIDRSLTKEGYINILDAIDKTMLEFIGYLEKKYDVEIELR